MTFVLNNADMQANNTTKMNSAVSSENDIQ